MITPPARPAILVSGASFAGLASAFWMNRLGYRVTVVEAARGLRTGGTPVDIEGETIEVLTRMGLMEDVRAKALPPRVMEFKDRDDCTIGTVGSHHHAAGTHAEQRCEIHRDDLLAILHAALAETVETMFGSTIRRLENGPDSVSVIFDDDSRRDFALVLGCDGNRSPTRRLAFGQMEDHSYFMGGYFLIKVVPATGLLPVNTSQVFSVPGRTALLNGYHDQTDIAFAFRSEREIDYDHRDRTWQRRIVHEHFDDLGWKVPAMLHLVDADDAFYFDKLNQIRMPTWSTGRVALVGDAGYCVSPLAGMGGSMAIIGASRLATAFERFGGDHAAAFQAYHDGLRAFVEEVQEMAVRFGMAFMFPADEAGLSDRDRRLGNGLMEL